MDLRLLTYNIHHGEGVDGRLDLERICRVIASSDADVVALQEVDRWFGARSGWADQAGYLATRLELDLAYAPSIDLPPRQVGERRRRYGLAVLSRFPITRTRVIALPTASTSEPRVLQHVDLDVAGTALTVFNTHLQWPEADERRAQAEDIARVVRATAGATVLLGDFNATPDSDEIGCLVDELADTWAVAGSGPGYTESTQHPAARIDYIFASAGVEVHSAAVLAQYAVESDHFPYAAQLSLGQGAAGPD